MTWQETRWQTCARRPARLVPGRPPAAFAGQPERRRTLFPHSRADRCRQPACPRFAVQRRRKATSRRNCKRCKPYNAAMLQQVAARCHQCRREWPNYGPDIGIGQQFFCSAPGARRVSAVVERQRNKTDGTGGRVGNGLAHRCQCLIASAAVQPFKRRDQPDFGNRAHVAAASQDRHSYQCDRDRANQHGATAKSGTDTICRVRAEDDNDSVTWDYTHRSADSAAVPPGIAQRRAARPHPSLRRSSSRSAPGCASPR